jgi:hypothetical protein
MFFGVEGEANRVSGLGEIHGSFLGKYECSIRMKESGFWFLTNFKGCSLFSLFMLVRAILLSTCRC